MDIWGHLAYDGALCSQPTMLFTIDNVGVSMMTTPKGVSLMKQTAALVYGYKHNSSESDHVNTFSLSKAKAAASPTQPINRPPPHAAGL